jgi:ribonuclease P protein component
MNFTYPKKKRKTKVKSIGLLFSEGKSVSKYPYDSFTIAGLQAMIKKIKWAFLFQRTLKSSGQNYFKRILLRPTV